MWSAGGQRTVPQRALSRQGPDPLQAAAPVRPAPGHCHHCPAPEEDFRGALLFVRSRAAGRDPPVPSHPLCKEGSGRCGLGAAALCSRPARHHCPAWSEQAGPCSHRGGFHTEACQGYIREPKHQIIRNTPANTIIVRRMQSHTVMMQLLMSNCKAVINLSFSGSQAKAS